MAEREIRLYQQVSLTRDFCRMGFDIPAMWGHYGDKGKGVCVIFDKKKLLDNLSSSIFSGEVDYVAPDYSFSVYFRVKDDKIEPFTREDIMTSFLRRLVIGLMNKNIVFWLRLILIIDLDYHLKTR